MRLKFMTFVFALGAFVLAACGAAPAQTWPGLTTNGEIAYVASGQQIHAVRVADGSSAWTFPAVVSDTTGIFVADPAVSADVIVVGSEGPNGQYSGLLFGLNPADGKAKWCLSFDQKGNTRSQCPMVTGGTLNGGFFSPAVDNRIVGGLAVADGMAYVGLANGKFFAVDAATGKDLWQFAAKRDIWAPPLVVSATETVYVTSLDHRIYALDTANNGRVRWERDLLAAVAGTPTLSEDGETLYIGTFGSELYALDAATGEPRWAQPLQALNWVWAGPTLAEGVLYFTDVAGNVYAADAATGAQRWSVKPGGLMRAAPAIAGDLLFVGDRDDKVYALNKGDGSLNWQQQLKGDIIAPILVVDDVVLVAPFAGDNLLVGYSLDGQTVPIAFAPTQ